MIEQILAELELASLNAFQSDGNRITLSNTAIDIVVHETWVELWLDGNFEVGNSNVDVIIENAIKAWKEYK